MEVAAPPAQPPVQSGHHFGNGLSERPVVEFASHGLTQPLLAARAGFDMDSTTRVFTLFAESSPIQYEVFYNRETAMQGLKE